MDTITQEAHFRKRMLRYLENHSATETAIRYKTSRKTLYKWKKRYEKDPDIESLKDRSRRPKRAAKSAKRDGFKCLEKRKRR